LAWEVSSLSDDPRTAEQLRAEIAVLKQQIEERSAVVASPRRRRAKKPAPRESRGPGSVSVSFTRRATFAMWLAPVILLAPAVKSARRLAKAVKRRMAA
jgi:hypothetical protein